MSRRSGCAGFSLVESLATIVVLGIALVGVAQMVGVGVANSADTLLQTRAVALGQSYLDEILGRRFDEESDPGGLNPCYGFMADMTLRPCTEIADLGPDGAAESSRDRFDDVDDYDGLLEGDGETDPITEADGVTVRPDYENFHVEVTVRYAGDDDVLSLTPTDAKLITVSIRHRAQTQGWEFSVYKGNY